VTSVALAAGAARRVRPTWVALQSPSDTEVTGRFSAGFRASSHVVERDGVEVAATVTGSSFTDTGVLAGTTYTYQVGAVREGQPTQWSEPRRVTTVAASSLVFEETFTGGGVGEDVTGANSRMNVTFTAGTGTHKFADFFSNARGGYASSLAETESNHYLTSDAFTTMGGGGMVYMRLLFETDSLANTSTLVPFALYLGTTSSVTRLGITSADKFVLQNGPNTVSGSSSTITALPNTKYRVELDLNTATGDCAVRIFAGANVNGTVPDDSYTVAGACALNATADRIRTGHIVGTASMANTTLRFGTVEVSTTAFTAAPESTDSGIPAPTRYASPGDDLKTILESLQPGDVLGLNDGTYTGDILTSPYRGTATNRIVVRAVNEHKVLIDGRFRLYDPDYVTVWGIRFTNPTPPASDGKADRILEILAGDGWIIDNCEIFGGTYAGILVGHSGVYGGSNNYTIRGCWVHDTDNSSLYCNTGPDTVGGLIERNIFDYRAGSNGSSSTKLGWGGSNVASSPYGIGGCEFRYNTCLGSGTIAEASGPNLVSWHHNLMSHPHKSSGTSNFHALRIDNVEGQLNDNVQVDDNAWATSDLFAYDFGDAPTIMAQMDRNVKVVPNFNDTTNGWTGYKPQDATAARYGRWA
jgi:hypothetical protein